MNTYNYEELDKMSGFEKTSRTKYPFLKYISAEGSKSKAPVKSFVLLRNDRDGNLIPENLGNEVKVIFISVGKFKLKKGAYITNEIVPGKDKEIDVYCFNRETRKRNFENRGLWRSMKEKYDLSTYQYPYVLIDDEIVKLGVLPSSLSNYWDYRNSFKENERIYEYKTILKGAKEAKRNLGGVYYDMIFEKGAKLNQSDLEKAVENIKEFRKFRETEESRYMTQSENQNEPRFESDDIPIIEIEEDTNRRDDIEDYEGYQRAFGE